MKKHKLTPPLGLYEVQTLAHKEFVRRTTRCPNCDNGYNSELRCEAECISGLAMQGKTYQVNGYDASMKRYSLQDCDDISREIYIKRGTMLYAGFTY